MTNSPRISIVIPFRNRFSLLERSLESIQLQNQNIEIILVNDDSTELGIDRYLQKFQSLNIKYLHNSQRLGPGASRNRGMAAATGTYICFLDADDFWKEGFLNAGTQLLENNPDAAGCILFPKNVYDNVPVIFQIKARFFATIKLLTLLFFYFFNKGKLMPAAAFVTQVSHMIFRRVQICKFREDMAFAEDWWMTLETANKGALLILPRQLAFYYFTNSSYTWEKYQERANLKVLAYKELLTALEERYPKNIFTFLFRLYSKNIALNK